MERIRLGFSNKDDDGKERDIFLAFDNMYEFECLIGLLMNYHTLLRKKEANGCREERKIEH